MSVLSMLTFQIVSFVHYRCTICCVVWYLSRDKIDTVMKTFVIMFSNLFILTIASPLFVINSPLAFINIVKDNPFGPDAKRISKTVKGHK